MRPGTRTAALLSVALMLVACSSGEGSSAGSGDGHDHDHGEVVGGFALAANAGGYLLLPERTELEPGLREIRFSIIGRDGSVQQDFDIYHEERMHLLLVSHDMQRYLHLHPEMSEDGTWSTTAELSHPGPWRMVSDFVPGGGENTILGVDLQIGEQDAVEIPVPTADFRTSRNGPFEATLEGETAHERDMPLRITITRDGQPIESSAITQWMGADAHMVAFMTHPDEPELGDLPAENAFIHMHPNGNITDGSLTFTAPPTPHGWWQIFVDTILDGEPRMFRFKVYAP